jgi:hypothetical protein
LTIETDYIIKINCGYGDDYTIILHIFLILNLLQKCG